MPNKPQTGILSVAAGESPRRPDWSPVLPTTKGDPTGRPYTFLLWIGGGALGFF